MTDDQRKSVDPAESSGTPDPLDAAATEAQRSSDPAAQAADRVRAARPVRKRGSATTPKKSQPTPAQDAVAAATHHAGPVTFTKQSVAELKKVIWPSGEQLGRYFSVVLVFVLFIVAYVGLLDLFFGWGLLKLLGK